MRRAGNNLYRRLVRARGDVGVEADTPSRRVLCTDLDAGGGLGVRTGTERMLGEVGDFEVDAEVVVESLVERGDRSVTRQAECSRIAHRGSVVVLVKGHFKKRGASWYYWVELERGPDGQRQQKFRGGFKTRKDAEHAFAELRDEVRRGAYVERSQLSLNRYLEEEWPPSIEASVRPTTLRNYRDGPTVPVGGWLVFTPNGR
jgi:hypothetical protein